MSCNDPLEGFRDDHLEGGRDNRFDSRPDDSLFGCREESPEGRRDDHRGRRASETARTQTHVPRADFVDVNQALQQYCLVTRSESVGGRSAQNVVVASGCG